VKAYVNWVPARGAKNYSATQHINANPSLNAWVDVDTSYKQYEFTSGANIRNLDAGSAELRAAIAQYTELMPPGVGATSPDGEALWEAYQQRFAALRASLAPATTPDALLGSRRILQAAGPILAGSLPYRAVLSSSLSSLTEALRYYIEVSLFTSRIDQALGNAAGKIKLALPRVGLNRLSVTATPATEPDEAALRAAQESPDFATLPLYAVHVLPQLRATDTVLLAGPSVAMGSDLFWQVDLLAPNGVQGDSHVFELVAGDEGVLSIDGSGVSAELYNEMFAAGTNTAAGNLHQIGVLYWSLVDETDAQLATVQGLRHVRLPSFGMFLSALRVKYFYGLPAQGNYVTRGMDVPRILGATSATDPAEHRDFALQAGLKNSYFESAAITMALGYPSGIGVSTATALSQAGFAGNAVLYITPENLGQAIAALPFGADLKAHIGNAVAAGRHALVPAAVIEKQNWRGAAYAIIDPDTGAGAYLVNGNANGSDVPKCECELVKKPLTESVAFKVVSAILLAVLIGLIAWWLAGLLGPAVPALAKLALSMGLTAFFYPAHASAPQGPPRCLICAGSNCPKPDLYRNGASTRSNLDNVREKDVEWAPGTLELGPPDSNGIVRPSAGIVLPSLEKGVSTFESPGASWQYPWVFRKELPVPLGLCVTNNYGSHWIWVPEAPTELNAFKGLLRAAPFEKVF
jgi:hypothetical protein